MIIEAILKEVYGGNNTPRGPSMEIRPTPETIIGWATKTGLSLEKYVELPPYHFGLVFIKK
jgi:hypothetical protein